MIRDHSTKVKRAYAAAAIGAHPNSRSAMLAHVPTSAVAKLTGAEIGELLDAMWSLAQASKAIAVAEVVAEGIVWDARRGEHREIR